MVKDISSKLLERTYRGVEMPVNIGRNLNNFRAYVDSLGEGKLTHDSFQWHVFTGGGHVLSIVPEGENYEEKMGFVRNALKRFAHESSSCYIRAPDSQIPELYLNLGRNNV